MGYQNLVSLLEEMSSTGLQRLRDRYADAGGILSSSRELGELNDAASGSDAESNNVRPTLVGLVQVGVEDLKTVLEELGSRIRARMKFVSNLRFFGAIIAAVSGGLTALLPLWSVDQQGITATGALVSMLGGLIALFADQFERAPSGIRIASFDEYGKLIEMRGDVERMSMKLRRDGLISIPMNELNTMLERLDGYSSNIIRLRFA
jgi:hypothetical protein